MSGTFEETCKVPLMIMLKWKREGLGPAFTVTLLRVLSWMEEVLGPDFTVSLLDMLYQVEGNQISNMRLSWRSQQHDGG